MNVVVNKKFKMMPARPGTCAFCARDHESHLAHDVHSLFYQTRFYLKWGRYPTWADACAHLAADDAHRWQVSLAAVGQEWTDPKEGEPIAEPYAMVE